MVVQNRVEELRATYAALESEISAAKAGEDAARTRWIELEKQAREVYLELAKIDNVLGRLEWVLVPSYGHTIELKAQLNKDAISFFKNSAEDGFWYHTATTYGDLRIHLDDNEVSINFNLGRMQCLEFLRDHKIKPDLYVLDEMLALSESRAKTLRGLREVVTGNTQ